MSKQEEFVSVLDENKTEMYNMKKKEKKSWD